MLHLQHLRKKRRLCNSVAIPALHCAVPWSVGYVLLFPYFDLLELKSDQKFKKHKKCSKRHRGDTDIKGTGCVGH